ncbi:hypothetical protein C8035_v010351 [Colletotrichum spinosum]|uniref:Uncharacterized protein n=1 Tax=Colletotrichum spinosum TaxID=1347390 RepID=A0A4R8QKI1_9PEZI|nr:hypothetical protein C8035_v010351 [Colletotrichum spinosum]
MKFSIQAAALLVLAATVHAVAVENPASAVVRRNTLLLERQGANENRPIPNGACCVANTSLKQDVCNVNGQTGRCVPDNINNCGAQLTCIEDSRLNCDPNTLERGRPLCRRKPGA